VSTQGKDAEGGSNGEFQGTITAGSWRFWGKPCKNLTT